MIGTIMAFSIPAVDGYIERGRIARAQGDIRTLQVELASMDTLPDDLSAIGRDDMLDPWRRPYVYHKFVIPPGIAAQARKDRFLVPLNSEYDLYSMGKDGDTQLPLTAPVSHDDIIRGNDGAFIGPATAY